ncbi:predicted protein [Histoplasma capsulatum G186AR]|uniref:C2H2-type domain-containing protein n=1 Tax=Ajellomyces capsulatus (strain G186AR / H82 / ATCC MYA-2454 / RMSCC 2432) TaxID=447093 RepID=C0NLQ5_AJECG|nr:uncharacterized protein HCBG_04435 [Histoplasma capsulatum G186AR]EEH07556.1 predicted protein [Histoplasma capsulatum G186AR]
MSRPFPSPELLMLGAGSWLCWDKNLNPDWAFFLDLGRQRSLLGGTAHQASQESLEASVRLARPVCEAEWKQYKRPLFTLLPLEETISRAKAPKTIEYLQGNPTIFQFDPDPKDDFTEEITIDPQLLILTPSPEAETGVYYNSQISNGLQDITQDDSYSLSGSSLDHSSSPLAGSIIEDFLLSTADKAQTASPVQEHDLSTSGQNPAHSLGKNHSVKLSCSGCGKVFELPCHLRKHEKYHIKSWPCKVRNCTKQFSRERDLKRHLGAIHPESFPELAKTYQCPKGDYETGRGENLKRHMETKHPNEPIPKNWRQVFLKRQ